MSFDRASLPRLIFALLIAGLPAAAQQPGQPSNQQPVEPVPPPPAQTAPSSAQQNVATQSVPPPQEPAVLEDGGFSIEPIYWLNRAQPTLGGGAQATTFSSVDYPGNSNSGIGGEFAIPTGHSNTLRISFFRIQGNANQLLTQASTVYGEPYDLGDYLAQNYTLQSAKISWDYLSYTWRKAPGNVHFKTLYEVQWTNISTNISAPFKTPTTDSSGNTDYNTGSGSQSVILPTLGVELEQAIHHNFRWEAKISGFGIPHHSNIWDAQADIAVRIRKFELIAGEKAYHFETSAQASQYFTDTLSGVFVGIRYYLGSGRR